MSVIRGRCNSGMLDPALLLMVAHEFRPIIADQTLTDFACDLFCRGRATRRRRLDCPGSVWSNLRGVIRTACCVSGISGARRKGINNPTPNIRTITDLPAAAVLKSRWCLRPGGVGAGGGNRTAKATDAGIGLCLIRHATQGRHRIFYAGDRTKAWRGSQSTRRAPAYGGARARHQPNRDFGARIHPRATDAGHGDRDPVHGKNPACPRHRHGTGRRLGSERR